MSSFTRSIQRALTRQKNFMGRGVKLGVTNPEANDLTARIRREDRHNAEIAYSAE